MKELSFNVAFQLWKKHIDQGGDKKVAIGIAAAYLKTNVQLEAALFQLFETFIKKRIEITALQVNKQTIEFELVNNNAPINEKVAFNESDVTFRNLKMSFDTFKSILQVEENFGFGGGRSINITALFIKPLIKNQQISQQEIKQKIDFFKNFNWSEKQIEVVKETILLFNQSFKGKTQKLNNVRCLITVPSKALTIIDGYDIILTILFKEDCINLFNDKLGIVISYYNDMTSVKKEILTVFENYN